jgi:hypothetical protein
LIGACRRCGYYRFADIGGGVGCNPAQYVRRPRVHPPSSGGPR